MSEGAEVWLVRHARIESDTAGIWEGRTDGDVDAVGSEQIAALTARLGGSRFDLVLSSPMKGARDTAAVFGDPIIENELMEIDGAGFDRPTDADEAPPGTGEAPEQTSNRIESVIDRLFDRLQPGERAVVVSHAAVLDAMTHRWFGRDKSRRRLGGLTDNTGITRLVRSFGTDRLVSFNDTGHLGPRPAAVSDALVRGQTAMVLVRHGQTRANVERRWQGQSDWGLDEIGRRQAAALAEWYGRPDRVVSSPLGRALETARAWGSEPEVIDGLVELGFGEWEGLTVEEVRSRYSVLFDQIYREGQDLPRGSTGESWAQLTSRFQAAIDSIDPARGQLTAVVTHGAAIRSYLADLAGSGWASAGRWETPANCSVTHLVFGEHGALIVDYSSGIHLESLQLTNSDRNARFESSKDEG